MSNSAKRFKKDKQQKYSADNPKPKSLAEVNLESSIFGSEDVTTYLDPLVNLSSTPAWAKALGAEKPKNRKIRTDTKEEDALVAVVDEAFEGEVEQERSAAWKDDDDEEGEYNVTRSNRLRKLRESHAERELSAEEYQKRLRQQFNRTTTDSSWAALPSQKEPEDEAAMVTANILSSSSALTYEGVTKRKNAAADLAALPAGIIEMTRMPDANVAAKNMSVTSSGRFHPNGELFMTAGLDKTIRIFHIDCERNPKVQSVYIPDLPIYCARFMRNGSEIIATGRRKYFYSYDLVKGAITKVPGVIGRDEKSLEQFEVSPDGDTIAIIGTDGFVLLLNGKSKQLVGTLRAPCRVAKIAFSYDSTYVYATCGDGRIYTFDVRTRTCLDKFADEGCIHGTAIGASWDGQYICAGSDSGVANIYSTAFTSNSTNDGDSYADYYGGYDQTSSIMEKKPLKALLNLTTAIDHISFSKSNEIMAFSSSRKKDQLRLVHLPSMTVFSNWPTANTPLSFIQDIDFSPSSGLFAASNDKGKTLLYRINHYLSS